MISRGLRNRNPGNIRHSSSRFKGEDLDQSKDSAFKQFRGEAWGYRAMFVILNTYNTKYGLSTISEMISRWAPENENNTSKYIATVARRSMLDANTPIDTKQRVAMVPLVAAMSWVENGMEACWTSVERGWDLFETDLDLSSTH